MGVAEAMTASASIARQVVTQGAAGGAVRSWPGNRLTGIPCRVSALSSREVADFQRADSLVTSKIYFAQDVALLKEDRITVTWPAALNRATTTYLTVSYQGTDTPDANESLFTAYVTKRN